MRRWLAAFVLSLAALAGQARGQALTADLSSHIIGITTGFAGAKLVLFGATDRPGDIVVVVRGPPTDIMIRRKERIMGLWINGSRAVFHDAPSFYAVAANRPLAGITTPDVLARHNIGLENIRLQLTEAIAEPDLAGFRAALLESQTKAGLYHSDSAPVGFLGQRLFRTDMEFPANVPTGNYSVEVYLFADGQLIGAQTTALVVGRVGFSNGVFVVARRHGVLYGAGALVFAVAAGWAAGAAFRRV
jgi:uncharacterized protein (TIGR02186 family)